MGVPIDVITGFLEAGKTTFIQNYLQQGLHKGERLLIILCEDGVCQLEKTGPRSKGEGAYRVERVLDEKDLSEALFERLERLYAPDHILVEYNGTWPLSQLLKLKLPQDYFIGSVLHVVDASSFALYMTNMSLLMSRQLIEGEAILLNRYKGLSQEACGQVEETIQGLAKGCPILYEGEAFFWKKVTAFLGNGYKVKKARELKLAVVSMGIVLAVLCGQLLGKGNLPPFYNQWEKLLNLVISTLLEATPFILIGVVLASILQFCLSERFLIKLFTTPLGIGYIVALGLGAVIPVCDCAMVPITASLFKKGVPLSKAMTFLLAAPVMNPIVWLSTYYAFPSQPELVGYRILVGLGIALVSGLILEGLMGRGTQVIKFKSLGATCQGGYLGELLFEDNLGRIEAILKHSALEFLRMMGYVLIGTILSALVQLYGVEKLFIGGTSFTLSFGFMLLAAFLVSVCASSNAFIGRGFIKIVPLGSLLGYLIMGPMLDIKNLLLMGSYFSKKFVGLYIAVVISVSFIAFSVLNQWL